MHYLLREKVGELWRQHPQKTNLSQYWLPDENCSMTSMLSGVTISD
jgi:hypothetical protein